MWLLVAPPTMAVQAKGSAWCVGQDAKNTLAAFKTQPACTI